MELGLEHYFLHKRNFIEKDCCSDYVNELNKASWKKHTWYKVRDDELEFPSGDNEPEELSFDLFSEEIKKINDHIIQKLHSVILEYITSFDFDWFIGWEGYSAIKFIRYNPNQTMENHCDHIHSLFDGEKKGIPILSIIGILNDDYEGGNLIMFEDKKIDTKNGDLIIFPSNFLYPHEITPVTEGVRYSYTSWVW